MNNIVNIILYIRMYMSIGFLIDELEFILFFFFSSRRRHTRLDCDWSSDVCSSDLASDGAVHSELLAVLQRDGREHERQRATRQHRVPERRVAVGRRPILTGQKVDVTDPEPDRRRGHPRRVDVLLEHPAEWARVVEAPPPPPRRFQPSAPPPPL